MAEANRANLKHRQHYVWKHYLEAWATNGQVCCFQEGRRFRTNAANVAVQRDFYKLVELTPGDIDLIRRLAIASTPEAGRYVHEHLLQTLAITAEIHRSGLGQSSPAVRAKLEEAMTNMVEDYHASIEVDAQPLLDAARRGDLSFYRDDQRAMRFAYFLAMQALRTRAARDRVVEQLRAGLEIDVSRAWTILYQIFATNVAGTLFVDRSRRELSLLTNATANRFITGDQPVVNLAADGRRCLSSLFSTTRFHLDARWS